MANNYSRLFRGANASTGVEHVSIPVVIEPGVAAGRLASEQAGGARRIRTLLAYYTPDLVDVEIVQGGLRDGKNAR